MRSIGYVRKNIWEVKKGKYCQNKEQKNTKK